MIEKLISKSPLDDCVEKIDQVLGNDDCLVLQQINTSQTGYKKFPLRLEVSMLNEIDSLAYKTGYNRTELITVLLDYALKRIKLV